MSIVQVKHKGKLTQFNAKIVDPERIADANNVLFDLCDALHNHVDVPPFDSGLSQLDANQCHSALIKHRILKKVIRPSDSDVDKRQAAFDAYKTYDESLGDTRINFWAPNKESWNLRKARLLLASWLKNTSLDATSGHVEFSPGESYNSTRGDTSILGKLENKEHWTTTYECLDDTCALVYQNVALRRIAKRHIGLVSKAERRFLYYKHRNTTKISVGYAIFSELLYTRVLTIVDGARGSSVFKDVDEDRMINVEAMFPCILQRRDAGFLKQVLRSVGNDIFVRKYAVLKQGNDEKFVTQNLEKIRRIAPSVGFVYEETADAQADHKRLIADSSYATVDFSKASDSIRLVDIENMYPVHVSRQLLKHRSTYVELGDLKYEPFKLSSMGNGFTFEVMTLLLLSVARVLDPTARVFGDDVIIKNDVAEEFVRTVGLLKFRANLKKTFIKSKFRESCGSFYHDDRGYLLSYDVKTCDTLQDMIVCYNKLRRLGEVCPHDGMSLDIQRAASAMLKLIPALARGPVTGYTSLNHWAESEKWRSSHSKSSNGKMNFHQTLTIRTEIKEFLHFNAVGIVFSPRFVNSTKKTSRYVSEMARLYSGRPVKRTIRGKGKWEMVPYLVDSNGSVVALSQAVRHVKACTRLARVIILRALVLYLLTTKSQELN